MFFWGFPPLYIQLSPDENVVFKELLKISIAIFCVCWNYFKGHIYRMPENNIRTRILGRNRSLSSKLGLGFARKNALFTNVNT